MSTDESSGGTVTEDFVPAHVHNILGDDYSSGWVLDLSGYNSAGSWTAGFVQTVTSGTAWSGYELVFFMKVKY